MQDPQTVCRKASYLLPRKSQHPNWRNQWFLGLRTRRQQRRLQDEESMIFIHRQNIQQRTEEQMYPICKGTRGRVHQLCFFKSIKIIFLYIQFMNNPQLLATLRSQQEEIRRLRQELANKNSVNYEEKYKKALKSIEEIIRANQQIKDELDALRTMRNAEAESIAQIQKEEFRKAYDALLKEKNTLVISYQSLQLENEKLKCTVAELQNQVALYKADRFQKSYEDRQTHQPTVQPDILGLGLITGDNSPRKAENRDNREVSQLLREKEAEYHRTLQNYQEHHSNLIRTNKRLEERLGELENKLINTEKNYKNKLENKELQVIEIKALTRQEFTEHIAALRKENSSLKLANNDLLIKIESLQKNITQTLPQKFDWQADLVQEMIAVKSNLQPLRQQISQLQELNIYQKEQSIREKTNLRTQVLELEAEVQRQNQTIKNLQRKIVESHQEKLGLEEKAGSVKKYQEQNQLLRSKIIVMQSREVALRNRTGEELEERVLQFQNRIQLLLSNKQDLKELREINIHQFLALKAYIMELDAKIKELVGSNTYLTKKYKSYKEKYQFSLKEYRQYEMTINSLKMKIMGYDKLVLKLQQQLEIRVSYAQQQTVQLNVPIVGEDAELYRKKYELMKEKLQIQQKYKSQEIETLKLNYQTRIMEINIQVEQMKSMKETLQLYRSRNEELQMLLTRKDSQLYQSKRLSSLKASHLEPQPANTRQTKDIINNLHLTIKQSDESILKLQAELRNKEENYKKTIAKLERQINDLKEEYGRQINKKDIEFNLQYEQEIKKYKLKISDLEHQLHLLQLGHKDDYNKKTDDFELKLRQLEVRVQEAEEQREEEIFSKRRLQKQVLNLTLDKQQLQGIVNDLEGKLASLKHLERENQELKSKSTFSFKQDFTGSMDYQLQSKDNIIRKLNSELLQLKSTIGEYSEKDITIGSLKNEIYYLKQQNQDLTQTINRYNQQIISLKTNIEHNRASYNSGLESMLQEKENSLNKLRKDLSNKEFKIRELQDEIARLDEAIRRMRKDLSQIQYIKQENERIQRALDEKSALLERTKYQSNGYEQQAEKYKQQLSFLKDNLQKLNYQLLERDDHISKLNLELSTANLKGKEQFENTYLQELDNKERQYNKINSDYLALRSTLTLLEEDKSYHEENYKRANNELMNIRTQYNLLQDENAALSDQLYRKTQEISKLQFSVQNFEGQFSEFSQKDEQLYKIKNQLFSLRTSNSALEDELYNKQANISRVQKQLNYMKQQYSQLEQELKIRQQTINRLNFEVNNARRQNEQIYESLQEKDIAINRLNIDITNQKNKYNELEEEVEERQQQFTNASQEINQLKANLGYFEDDIEEKKGQIVRLTNEREVLRAEIVRLNEVITERNVEINRLKQQIFAVKMEISQNEYEKQLKSQQEIMSFKAKINMLEHQLQDKQTELRRLSIELETSRYKPVAAVPEISEQELQQLRNEVNKKQRQLISMKYELDDKQFQLESANSTLNMLKNSINQQQIAFEQEQAELDRIIRDLSLRERKCNEEITFLNDEIQRLRVLSQVEKPKSYAITYSEEEMNIVQDKLNQKQAEIITIKNQVQEKQFYIQNLNGKMIMQEHLIQQLELQFQQYQTRSQADIQEFIKREKTYRLTIDELQENHQRQMQEAHYSHERALNAVSSAQQEGSYDYQGVIRSNIAEIDRLNKIIADLQEEIASFKLKLSSMVNQQNRLQENLVTMVLLFSQIEALRDRMKVKESEINEVRKSFIQMTVAGEIESNKMSRILSLAKQHLESHEQLEYESNSRSEISTPKNLDTPIRQPFQEFKQQLFSAAPSEKVQFDKGFLKKQQHQSYIEHKEQNYYSFQAQQPQIIVGYGQGHYYEGTNTIHQAQEVQVQPENQSLGGQQEAIQHQEQYQTLQEEVYQSKAQNISSPQQIQPNPAEQSVPQSSEGSGAQPHPNQPAEEKKNEIGGSLILQLQKEPQRLNQSRAGQIIIKIPSTSQVSVTRSLVSEPPKIISQPGYPQPPMRIVNPPYSMTQVARHSQQVIHQVGQHHLPYHSQGVVPPQQQIVRVSPSGRVIGPAPHSVSPAHRPSFS